MSANRWADTMTEDEIAAALDDRLLAPRVGEGFSASGTELALLNAIQLRSPFPAAATVETWSRLRFLASRRRERLLDEIRHRAGLNGWWVPEREQPPLVERPQEDQGRWTWRIARGGQTREVMVAVSRTTLASRDGEGQARLAVATGGLSEVARAAMEDEPPGFVYIPDSMPDMCSGEDGGHGA